MPILNDIFNSITGGIFKGAAAEDEEQEGSATGTSTSSALQVPGALQRSYVGGGDGQQDDEDDEVVEISARAAGRKPERNPEVLEQFAQRSRKERQTQFGSGLAPDSRTQANTKRKVLTNDGVNDELRPQLEPKRPKMGGFKPTNTLNSTPHAPRRMNANSPRALTATGPVKVDLKRKNDELVTPKLPVETKKGGNVRTPARDFTENIGDGFRSDSASKRQKIDYGSRRTGIASDPIDLEEVVNAPMSDAASEHIVYEVKPASGVRQGSSTTGRKSGHGNAPNGRASETVDLDGVVNGAAAAANTLPAASMGPARARPAQMASSLHVPGAPPKAKATSQPRKEKHSDHFDTGFAGSNAWQMAGKKKQTRNRKKGHRTDSATETPSVASARDSGAVSEQTGSRNAPVSLDDEGSQSQQQKSGGARRRHISQDGQAQPAKLQPINLDTGVFDKQATNKTREAVEAAKRHFIAGVGATAQTRHEAEKRRIAAEKASREEIAKSKQNERPKNKQQEGTSLWGYADEAEKEQAEEAGSRLSNTFVRDGEGSAANGSTRHQKAQYRMQTTSANVPSSRVSPVEDSFGSTDPLHGGTTIGTQASRSASPTKMVNGGVQAGSPSDIRHTEFTISRKDKQKARQVAAEQGGDLDSCHVLAIYSVARCLVSGEATLVYDHRAKTLDIYEGDSPAQLSNGQYASIGVNEARKMFYCHGVPRVYILGSATAVSNGKICIAFANYNGVDWLMTRLDAVTDGHVQCKPDTEDRLNKIFRNQSQDIQTNHDQAKIRAAADVKRLSAESRRTVPGNAERTARTRAREVVDDRVEDDEEIQYDKGAPPQRTSRARAMLDAQAAKLSGTGRASISKETSPYFPPDEPTRRSGRERKPAKERTPSPPIVRWSQTDGKTLKRWSKPVEYPPGGARRVTVDWKDLERLDEGEWLNDNVVGMQLRKIEEEMAPEYKESVHFFNTFFYSSLSTKNGKKTFNYDSVKKWTKSKDILTVPYVVVPVNLDMHWFVAIIANLNHLKRKTDVEDDEDEPEDEFDYQKDLDEAYAQESEAQEEDGDTIAVANAAAAKAQPKNTSEAADGPSLAESRQGSPAASTGDSPGEVFTFGSDDQVVHSGDEGHFTGLLPTDESRPPSVDPSVKTGTANGAGKKFKKKAAPRLRSFDVDSPAVIVLDSFGQPHTGEVRVLKDYIIKEAETKRGMAVEREKMQGVTAKGIPQQANFWDCGVYLIGYVEEFAKDPRAFVEKVLSRQMDQQADFANFDPSAKRAEIRESLLKLSDEQEAQRREAKKAKAKGPVEKPVAGKATTTAAVKTSGASAELKEEIDAKQTRPEASEPPAPFTGGKRKAWAPPEKSEPQIEKKPRVSAAQPVVANNEEDDELEYEAPRALEPLVSGTRLEFNGSQDGDDNDNEMLDDSAPGPPAESNDLVNTLLHDIAHKTPLAEASSREPSVTRAKAAQSASEDDSEDVEEESSRQPVDNHEGQLQRMPEVADSQGSVVAMPDSQQWKVSKGTHTHFD